jgi:hypothetical protein
MPPSQSASESGVRWTKTDRGFKHYGAIPVTRGNVVRVFESSAADGPHLWVTLDDPHGHLTLDQAVQLRDTLTAAITGHYQVEQPDPARWAAGDRCAQCGSTDTGLENDVAFCRGCGARDV